MLMHVKNHPTLKGNLIVFLDGSDVTHRCTAFDEDAQMVLTYATHPATGLAVIENGEMVTETRYGKLQVYLAPHAADYLGGWERWPPRTRSGEPGK